MNQEKLIQLELLNQQLAEIEQSIFMSEDQLLQLESAKEALKNLENKDDEVLIPLSSGIFIPVRNVDLNKIKFLVGSNVVVDKTSKEAIEKITEYVEEIKNHKSKSVEFYDKVSMEVIKLQKELDEVDE